MRNVGRKRHGSSCPSCLPTPVGSPRASVALQPRAGCTPHVVWLLKREMDQQGRGTVVGKAQKVGGNSSGEVWGAGGRGGGERGKCQGSLGKLAKVRVDGRSGEGEMGRLQSTQRATRPWNITALEVSGLASSALGCCCGKGCAGGRADLDGQPDPPIEVSQPLVL